jgi:hypothetical protein
MLYVQRFLKKNLVPLKRYYSFEEWLESTSYNGQRKDQLREARATFKTYPDRKKCERISSFVKSESYPEFKYPRWINSRCDAFKTYSGPIFKSIEEQVFKLKWFIKHTPVLERPAKISGLKKAGARYIQTDFSSFEAHFTPYLMEAVEFQLYDYMLQQFPADAKFIRRVLAGHNKGRTKDGVNFDVRGRRMSGEMCTSLGNGFTNLMVWGYLAERKGIRPEQWDGYVEGDDGIFAVTSPITITTEDYTNRGFNIKLNEFTKPELASFCGVISIGDTIIRDPFKWLAAFPGCDRFHFAGDSVRLQLLRAKALSASSSAE